MDHPNLELARRTWEAVSRSDVAALGKLWSKEIVWHATARGTPWAGRHCGTEAVLDHLARIGESVEIFDARLDDILVSGDRIAYIVHIEARRGGHAMRVDYLLLGRVEQGLVAEVWTAPLDPIALESFWQS
jgi:ketosteroid isomerase-like protein